MHVAEMRRREWVKRRNRARTKAENAKSKAAEEGRTLEVRERQSRHYSRPPADGTRRKASNY